MQTKRNNVGALIEGSILIGLGLLTLLDRLMPGLDLGNLWPLFLIAFGSFLYALGVGSVALGSSFEHFVVAMAIATIGEMITVPTATAITADLAPPDIRAYLDEKDLEMIPIASMEQHGPHLPLATDTIQAPSQG